MYGYHGQVMFIDLTRRCSRLEPLDTDTASNFLGGIGLAAWLLYKHAPPGLDPLSADSPLIYTTNPFLSANIPGSMKLATVCKSPLTNFIGDSLASGPFAYEFRKMPFDAMVVTGQAHELTLLFIENYNVNFINASHLKSLSAKDTETKIKTVLKDSSIKTSVIGPAGEALVRYACITNNGRQAGRTGTGAVMGSKNLKAIALKGNRPPCLAYPEKLEVKVLEISKSLYSKATSKYRGVGTVANLPKLNNLDALPSYNFRTGNFAGIKKLGMEALEKRRASSRNKSIAREWEHLYEVLEKSGKRTQSRLEYESLFALGPLCGIDDPDIIIKASALCDQLGLDTISTGGTIAWAMESVENGVLTSSDVDQIDLHFGNGNALLATIDKIGKREGIGDLLAEGSRIAAQKTGVGSDMWAMQVKGLEMPGYHPKKLKHLAVALAVSPRGACHNRSSAYDSDLTSNVDPTTDATGVGKVVAESEDFAAVLDSLIISKFLRKTFKDFYQETGVIYQLITGLDTKDGYMKTTGRRINSLRKAFNIREGWKREDDTLPPRIFEDGSLLLGDLNKMIVSYYTARGWTCDGLIPESTLHQLGLDNLSDPGTAQSVVKAGYGEQRKN